MDAARPAPAGAIDPVVHPLPRLRICAMLAAAEEVEFGKVQDHVGMSTSSLSKQVSALVDHGYVVQRRGEVDSRRRWLALTDLGRERYREHMAALTELAGGPPGA